MPPRGDLGNSGFNPNESQIRKEAAAKKRGASTPAAPRAPRLPVAPAGGGPFRRAGEQLIQGLMAGMYQSAIEIMRVSQGQVPVDTSVLKSSGRVLEPVLEGTTLVCTLGYGYGDEVNPKTGERAAGYAIPVHERLEVRHAPPTKAKYLEDPVLAYIKDFEPTLGAAIVRAEKSPTGLRTWLEQLHHDAGGLV